MCGAKYCPSFELNTQRTTDPDTVEILMIIYLVFGCLAILVIFLFLDKIDIEGDGKNESISTLFKATLKLLTHRKMKLLVPITVFSGLELGFVFADFSKVLFLSF